MSVVHTKELFELAELSAFVGRQKLLVQGSTGNTSIKIDGKLWVKASRKWLSSALVDEIFVPVDLATVEHSLSTRLRLPDSRLKPSIETFMHVVLPHRVVIHVHSISAIAWAVQDDAVRHLNDRLGSLRWCWIDYMQSGFPLAEAIRGRLHNAPDVLILGNHGLVIGADTCSEARRLLEEVESRLNLEPSSCDVPDLTALTIFAKSSGYVVPRLASIHSLGVDSVATRTVSEGVLYPCQAMFLGRSLPVFAGDEPISDFLEKYRSLNGVPPRVILIQGCGVLVAPDLNAEELEILEGLSQVTRRLRPDSKIRYLSGNDIDLLFEKNIYELPQLPIQKAASSGCRI